MTGLILFTLVLLGMLGIAELTARELHGSARELLGDRYEQWLNEG